MNVRDSEHIIAELSQKEDYELTDNIKEADLIIINTCSVREKPVSKLFSEIGQFKKLRKDGAKIGVAGCTASHLGKEIIKKAPVVDFVLGARNVSKITKVINQKGAVEIDTSYDESTYMFGDFRSNPYKAMVNISIGCDKSCTFCIVPVTRGEEISIPSNLIIQEIKKAVDNGAKEVTLLGQNVNNYGRRFSTQTNGAKNFTELLREVSKIEGLERIRFSSPHPLHMDDEFLEEFASNPKICKQIHVPLQSGSTKLLKRMKRGYSKEWFLNRCSKIRELVPNVAISTDIIVGFPGESEDDFKDTLDVLEKVKFDTLFSFKYSPRPHTDAAKYPDQVEASIASKRLQILQDRHKEIQKESMLSQVGKIAEVLFEELKSDGKVAGRSDEGRLVVVKGSQELLGKIAKVKITSAKLTMLDGKLI